MVRRCNDAGRRRVLFCSGSGRDAETLVRHLKDCGFAVDRCADPGEAACACGDIGADIVILDVAAGDISSSRVLVELEGDSRAKDIPVLVIDRGDKDLGSILPSRGCHIDSISAERSDRDVQARIDAMLRVAYSDGGEQEPGTRDAMTKAYSRRYAEERLETEMERARRYGRELSCVMVDIDGLQKINEARGHGAGDEILRLLADVLLSSARMSDVITRYGGDEFVLLLPETGGCDAGILAERLRVRFHERTGDEASGLPPASVSCGVATYPDHARDAATLVQMADSSVFKAKSEGGNRTVVSFEPKEEREIECESPRILLVEQSNYARSVASVVLRASGYDVIEASDGASAIAIARATHPDLVLIDLQLQDMSGLEATSRLVHMEETRDIPIVAMTSSNVPADLERLVKAGCRGYITKPIDTSSLTVEIARFFDGV